VEIIVASHAVTLSMEMRAAKPTITPVVMALLIMARCAGTRRLMRREDTAGIATAPGDRGTDQVHTTPGGKPMTRLAVFILGAVLAVAFFASLAPKPFHRPANPSIIPASVCGYHGAPIKATLTDTVAGDQYDVVCGDGIIVGYQR
jgi:hypothetical protein